jgi:RimJ/RimL family protein N-acetyltransferase
MIRTERLTLRPVRDADLDALFAIYSDPRVMRYINVPHPDRARTARMIEGIRASHAETGLDFVVERDGALVGRAGLWKLAEIGYAFHPDQWGQGVAREAVGALVDGAFIRHPGLDALTAEIDPRNTGSADLLARLGFREVDRVQNTVEIAGEWTDSAYWQLDRPPGPSRQVAPPTGPSAAR